MNLGWIVLVSLNGREWRLLLLIELYFFFSFIIGVFSWVWLWMQRIWLIIGVVSWVWLWIKGIWLFSRLYIYYRWNHFKFNEYFPSPQSKWVHSTEKKSCIPITQLYVRIRNKKSKIQSGSESGEIFLSSKSVERMMSV